MGVLVAFFIYLIENKDHALATPTPMRNKSMRPGKSTDPHQVYFRGAISFVPSGCRWKPTVFIKNTSGLQKMRTVLLIILEVEWTRLDKILEGKSRFEGFT